jgi:PAS domain S-box
MKSARRKTTARLNPRQIHDFQAQVAAISRSHAVVEFDTEGIVLAANENFLQALGYTLEEITGKHHRIFVDEAYSHTADYAQFWDKLRRGEYQAGRIPARRQSGTASLAPGLLQPDSRPARETF